MSAGHAAVSPVICMLDKPVHGLTCTPLSSADIAAFVIAVSGTFANGPTLGAHVSSAHVPAAKDA